MQYPRPIESIHQIEITSKCNLRCVYCPSPKLPKLRGEDPQFMRRAQFERSLEWAVELNSPADPMRAELSLTGIGETLLHPEFEDFLALAREALPINPIVFSTNGILLTDALCERIAPLRPQIYVSLHRPEKAAFAINAARKWGLLAGYNPSPATSAFDWAGQIDWPVSAPEYACEYLRSGWAVIQANGSITTCCLDATNAGVVGHIDDEIGSVYLKPYSLCTDCHMTVPT